MGHPNFATDPTGKISVSISSARRSRTSNNEHAQRQRPRKRMTKPPSAGGRKEGVNAMVKDNRWEQISDLCLTHAIELLGTETAPTTATVNMVKDLVETAEIADKYSRWEDFSSSWSAGRLELI